MAATTDETVFACYQLLSEVIGMPAQVVFHETRDEVITVIEPGLHS